MKYALIGALHKNPGRNGPGFFDSIQGGEGDTVVYILDDPMQAQALFDGCEESMVWSCLQGVMGKIYVDAVDNLKSAAACVADFCFFAGEPSEELVNYDYGRDFLIMTAKDPRWFEMIAACHGERVKRIERYAIKKEPGVFDTEKLKRYAEAIPEGYVLAPIDEKLYHYCKDNDWTRDWVSSYPTYTQYEEKGLGICLLKDGIPVAGASSYTSYNGGIEIQIDTHKEYRQQGLATICGAALILACLKRGLYPSWDAANKASLGLAEKLGYHYLESYEAWETR